MIQSTLIATWKVYSVIKASVLLENCARMITTESLSPDLEILNAIVTDVLDKVKELTGGS